MRLLLRCGAGLGHVHPLIPLARAAVAAGDQVLFVTSGAGVRTIQRLGFAAVGVPDGDPVRLAAAWSNLPDRDVNTHVVAEIFVRIQGRAALPVQRSLIEDFGADLVISSELDALVAAEAGGIARAYVGITSLDLDDLDLARVTEAVDDLRVDAGLPRRGQLPFPGGTAYLSPVPPLLWADPTQLPEGAIWYRHEDAEGPVERARRRTGRRPRVYATLGSVAGGQLVGQRVFPSMLEALGRLDADVMFTVGALAQAQHDHDVPPNVTVSGYLAQAEAMDCDAAVVHAGSGTTVAALARGLPMVAVPMFADQMHNADRLVEAGVGLRVDPEEIPDRLTSAVKAVLTQSTYRANARHVAATMATRPTPAEALELIRPRVTAEPAVA